MKDGGSEKNHDSTRVEVFGTTPSNAAKLGAKKFPFFSEVTS